jgi:CRP-like cAMP-binding protein
MVSGPEIHPRHPGPSFLDSLTPHQREALLALGRERLYDAGETLIREGDQGSHVVLLLDGVAKVVANAASGRETVLGIRGRGDLVGEMAVLSQAPRSAYVVAVTSIPARVIPVAPFTAYLERSPVVTMRLTTMVIERLRAANRRRVEFAASRAPNRVAYVLAEVAATCGRLVASGHSIGPEITQADLASLASVTRRTAEKALRTFEDEGLILRQGRELVVLDIAGLMGRADISDDDPS